MEFPLVLTIVLVAGVGVFFFAGVKVVPGSQQAVVFRLGRFKDVRRPGVTFVIPVVDWIVFVQMSQSKVVPNDPLVSKEGREVSLSYEVTIRVCDAEKAIIEVGDFEVETIDLLRVQLKRSAETYTSSELRNIRIQERMIEKSVSTVNEAVSKWGVEIESSLRLGEA